MSGDHELPLYQRVADVLHELGWRPNGDGQHTNLRDALPKLREMLAPPAGDGGPAFPGFQWTEGYGPWRKPMGFQTSDPPEYHAPGMTLRDHFAGLAMQGWLAGLPDGSSIHDDAVARRCYCIADAMLKARQS